MYAEIGMHCAEKEKAENEVSKQRHSDKALTLLTLEMKRNMLRGFWKVV